VGICHTGFSESVEIVNLKYILQKATFLSKF
jgi:hypothetical protein